MCFVNFRTFLLTFPIYPLNSYTLDTRYLGIYLTTSYGGMVYNLGIIDSRITSSHGTFSALLAFCAGNSPVTGEFPTQRPVTRSFDVFFDLRLNKQLSKQSWGWWFETPSRSLWRHCNVRQRLVACLAPRSSMILCWLIFHWRRQGQISVEPESHWRINMFQYCIAAKWANLSPFTDNWICIYRPFHWGFFHRSLNATYVSFRPRHMWYNLITSKYRWRGVSKYLQWSNKKYYI